MSAIILDRELRSKLKNLSESLELREEDGSIVGRFIPEDEFCKMQKELALAACPYSAEELQRLRKQRDGTSLAEFWKKQSVAS